MSNDSDLTTMIRLALEADALDRDLSAKMNAMLAEIRDKELRGASIYHEISPETESFIIAFMTSETDPSDLIPKYLNFQVYTNPSPPQLSVSYPGMRREQFRVINGGLSDNDNYKL